MTAPAMFSLLAPAYREKFGVSEEEMKDVLTRIAWKNHFNGARNPRAQFRNEVPKEVICASPLIAGQLGIFDCSGVSDGSAAAIIVRAEDASKYTDKPLYVKALSFASGSRGRSDRPELRLHDLHRSGPVRRGRVPAGGRDRPSVRAGDGGGARLLHSDRARADGGPRFLRTRPRVEGRSRRGVRPLRRSSGQPGRRAEVVRAPDRSIRPADAVRVLAPAPQRGAAPSGASRPSTRAERSV